MQRYIEISFDVGFMGCRIKIQQIWVYNNTVYVLSNLAIPREPSFQSAERIHDGVSIELGQELPTTHYLIIDPPLDTPFTVKGYAPIIIVQKTDIPETIRRDGQCLYQVTPISPVQIIDELVKRINIKLLFLIRLYNSILGDTQQPSRKDIQDEVFITELLMKNIHSPKEQFTLLLLHATLSMIEPSINNEVSQRLNLPKVDTTRLSHLAMRYQFEIFMNDVRAKKDAANKQHNIHPPAKPTVSAFSFFEPLTVAEADVAAGQSEDQQTELIIGKSKH